MFVDSPFACCLVFFVFFLFFVSFVNVDRLNIHGQGGIGQSISHGISDGIGIPGMGLHGGRTHGGGHGGYGHWGG